MNIEDVRKVFGAVAPTPVTTEQTSNIIPVILLIAVVGVSIYVYANNT